MAGSGVGLVSVALPVREVGVHFAAALRSILDQTHAELDVMVIVRAGDGATAEAVRAIAGGDDRVRILERPRPGLAAALNFAMREARADLVARMDGDDWSSPDRIAVQVAAMARDPMLSAVGGAYAVVDAETGEEIERIHPPMRPEEVRWRLVVGNTQAHGSMVVRRDAVVGAGGYDETIERGQDYDLWVRMTRRGMRIGNVPEVVYRHRMPGARRGVGAGDAAQAGAVGRVLLGAWGSLPATTRGDAIEAALARVVAGGMGVGAGMREIEAVLSAEGPTREGMMAWGWCRDRMAMAQWPAIEAGREAVIREVGERLREAGVDRVWLWGAGGHTRWMLGRRGVLGVVIAGVVDDARVGERIEEFAVVSSATLRPGAQVVLSSDTAEDVLWRGSAAARARGVRVWRVYGRDEKDAAEG
jgi:hypothetical protein